MNALCNVTAEALMPLGKSGFADKRVNSEIVSKSIAELKRTAEGKKAAKTSWNYTPENWEQQDKDAVQVNVLDTQAKPRDLTPNAMNRFVTITIICRCILRHQWVARSVPETSS